MEAGDRLNCHLYTCALCENLTDLSSACCCPENTETTIKVTEPRLLKRCNLQEGDTLCAVHYDKLKSGIIFGGGGGKSGCCAPFHVEQNHASRLRPVPRVWRQLFDSSDINNRYLPSLQICSQCYNITLDLVLIEDDKNDEQEGEDTSDTSSNEHNTSPRHWMSSIGLRNISADSSSDSTWSLNSSRQAEDSPTGLMSSYTARSDTAFSTAIPDSVKRYFRYSKRIGSVFNRKRKTIPRADSVESPDESFVGSETLQNDHYYQLTDRLDDNGSSQLPCPLGETKKSEKNLKCPGEAQTENICKEPAVKITLIPKSERKESIQPKQRNAEKIIFVSNQSSPPQEDVLLDFSIQIARSENAALISTSDSSDPDESVECQKCISKTQEKIKDNADISADFKNNTQTSCLDASANDMNIAPHKRKPMKITIKSIATSPKTKQSESISDNTVSKTYAENSPKLVSVTSSNIQFISIAPKNNSLENEKVARSVDNSCVSATMDNKCTTNQRQDKNGFSTARSSQHRRSSVQDVIEFLLTNFQDSDVSQNTAKKLLSFLDELRLNVLQVFAGTLAQSIVDFALQDVQMFSTNYDKKEEINCKNNSDPISWSNTWLQDVEASSQNLLICSHCGAPILRKISCINTFAEYRANDIIFGALQQMSGKEQKFIGQAETQDYQKTSRNTKAYYRTEFSIQINDEKSFDKKLQTLSNSSNANTGDNESKNKNFDKHSGDSFFQVINCIVEDLIPVTRSFSTGFIDKCVEDEDEDWSFRPIVRSFSSESFFTMTYQLSDEKKNIEDEFVIVPIDTKSQSHKEVESGVFMSATETDRSCTDSFTFPLTDYSDTDRESMSSHFTQMSSVDNSGIADLCVTSGATDLNKNTQDDGTLSNEILTPMIDEHSITLENLHSSELPQKITEECVVPIILTGVQESLCDDDLQHTAATVSDTAPFDNDDLSMVLSLHSGESLVPNPTVKADEMLLHSAYPQPEAGNDVLDSALRSTYELMPDPTHTKDLSDLDHTLLQNSNDVSHPTMQDALSEDNLDDELDFKHCVTNQPLGSIAEDQNDEKATTAMTTTDRRNAFREKTDRSTVDWFPSDDVLRQRQSTEFVRAINQAALLNARAPTIIRDKLRKSDEEPEDEDVCEVIGAAMEEVTPQLLRMRPRIKKEVDLNEKSSIILRIFTIMAALGFALFVSWRYYLSPLV